MLYTGDSVGTRTGEQLVDRLTVGRIAGRDYAVWSGWAQRAATDKTPQQLYIAPMENPWTIAANRVLLSAPGRGLGARPELDLQEGPELLRHGGDVFVIYSTRDSWLKEYALGQLRLRDTSANPLDPRSWTKRGLCSRATPACSASGTRASSRRLTNRSSGSCITPRTRRRRAGSAA